MNKTQGSARVAITKASEYMTGLYDKSEEFCNYALALSTFSMLREPSGRTPRTVSQMVADLKTRIITSKDCESLVMFLIITVIIVPNYDRYSTHIGF